MAHWMETIPLEELRSRGIDIIKKSKANGQREQDLIMSVQNAPSRNTIITILWNLNLSGQGLKVIGNKEKYDKKGKRKKKKKSYNKKARGLWNPPIK